MSKMNKEYRKLIEAIKVDGENYSDEEMKTIYKEQKSELDKLHAMLGTIFIKYGIDGFLKMNASQKAEVGIKSMLTVMGKKLGDSEVTKVADILANVFKDTYYKNAFVQESGIDIKLKFNILKKEYVNSAVNAKYKGEFFSERIWAQKADMIDKLQDSLIETMNGETTIDKVARDIKNTFNTTAYESQRLVNTENARVQTQASNDIGHDTGVDQQMYSATLERNTCEECGALDGKVFDIDDDSKPEIPVHPLCRCCWINVPYKGWQATQRKDNGTGELIPNQTYTDWAKEKGVE